MNDEHEPAPAVAPAVAPGVVPGIDRVLESLDGLADRPVEQHVAVFENAHEELRKSLDGAHGSTPHTPGPPA